MQGQGGRGADPPRGAILAHPDLVPRADAPRDSPSLADSSEEGSTDSETGHLMAEVLGDLPQEVVDTITSARAPSTRHAYALKWNLFVEWCSSHREDPGDARSDSCCPSCSKGWSEGCLPPPSRSTWPQLLPTTEGKGSRWGSMTGSSGALGGLEG